MRIQIVDLPSQPDESPYLVVISELSQELAPLMMTEHLRKEQFDHCAGVIATTEHVQIGEESLYELQQREQRQLRTAEANLGLPYGALLGSLVVPEPPAVECPEQAEGRGCACSLGAQDCPVNGTIPTSIGVMDIPHEERAVSVTENAGGARVAHIAIDIDQTPEELASDVAAIVEEQREYRHIGFCSCRTPSQHESTCGIPEHRDLARHSSSVSHFDESVV